MAQVCRMADSERIEMQMNPMRSSAIRKTTQKQKNCLLPLLTLKCTH